MKDHAMINPDDYLKPLTIDLGAVHNKLRDQFAVNLHDLLKANQKEALERHLRETYRYKPAPWFRAVKTPEPKNWILRVSEKFALPLFPILGEDDL